MKTHIAIRLCLFSAILYYCSSQDTPWNYAKSGSDWTDEYIMCDKTMVPQAPWKINTTNTKPMAKNLYFYPYMKTNFNAKLSLENFDNNIVLNPKDGILGNINYNFLDQGTLIFYDCQKIYFKVPGEHEIDGKKSDMEIQISCHGIIPGEQNQMTTMIIVPVKLADKASKFFEIVNGVLDKEVLIPDLNDLVNPTSMFNQIFFYIAFGNFPDCSEERHWIVVNKPVNIDSFALSQFKNLLTEKNKDGNIRETYIPTEDNEILLHTPQF